MATEVLVPLAGNIWVVLVNVGDEVEEDDELVVIEALKMENPVYASLRWNRDRNKGKKR